MRCGQAQAQPGAAPPCPAHDQRREPCEHGHMQAGDAHQVRDASGPKQIPLGAVNRPLIAHHQCRQHPSSTVIVDSRDQSVPGDLPGPLDQTHAGPFSPQANRWRAAAYVAAAPQTLLEQPQLVVKAMRIGAAMRPLQPQGELPAFADPQARHALKLTIGETRIPADPQAGRQHDIKARHGGCPHRLKHEAHPAHASARKGLRHRSDHAIDLQILPLQHRVQPLGKPRVSPQADASKRDDCDGCQPPHAQQHFGRDSAAAITQTTGQPRGQGRSHQCTGQQPAQRLGLQQEGLLELPDAADAPGDRCQQHPRPPLDPMPCRHEARSTIESPTIGLSSFRPFWIPP